MSATHNTSPRFLLKAVLACGLMASCTQSLMAAHKAYVFVGIDNNPAETAANVKAAASAKANYERQGYQVCVDNTPTKAEIIAACNDPNARGLWMVGHGGKTDGNYVPFWAYNTSAGATDRGVTPGDLGGGTFGQFTSVTFHGCGQLLQPWANKFPNATYTSWTGAVKATAIRWDEWWRGQNRIPLKGGGDTEGAGGGINVLHVDPRFDAGMPFTFFPDLGLELDVPRTDYAAMLWCMPEPLAAELGSVTFNVVVTDGFEAMASGGLSIVDGEVVDQVEDGYDDPDFVFVMHPLVALEAISNIDMLFVGLDKGLVGIEDNTTGIEDIILFEGAANVLFGLFSESCDGCPADFDGDGFVATADLLALLAGWGLCPDPDDCPHDLDGDGSVGTSDLLALLALWGACE